MSQIFPFSSPPPSVNDISSLGFNAPTNAPPKYIAEPSAINNRINYGNAAAPPVPPSPKFFSNPRGMVASFAQHAANQGFQRSNRFVVLLHGPNINGQFLHSVETAAMQNGDIMGPMFPPNDTQSSPPLLRTRDIVDFSSAIDIRMKERLALVCQDAQLPSKGLMTEDFLSTGSGAPLYHAYAENFTGELTLSFLCSSDMFERMYFSIWM
jgi:hypothetical protein